MEELLEKQLELIRAKRGSEKESQLEERIATLEARLEDKPKAEVDEALGDLSDAERKLILDHRAAPPVVEPDVKDKPDPDIVERQVRKRPGRKSGGLYQFVTDEDGRMQATDIPTVYSGPDEDDEVEIPDDEDEAA